MVVKIEELDKLDRKILYELDADSSQTFKKLGKKLRISKETVGYRIKRLIKDGYLKDFLTTINISNLNRFYYKIFYKFHKTTRDVDRKIIAFVKSYSSIAYFASLEGRYDITFLLLARNMKDLRKFLIEFRSQFGDYVLEQEILTMTNVHRFNFRFFLEGGELHHTKYPEDLLDQKIDALDYNIIKNLAANSRISLVELARQSKTDINVIKYRIKKLRKMNILGASVTSVNFDKFGLQHIQVDFSLRSPEVVDHLVNYIAEFNRSTFATTTIGKYDVAAEFVVESTKELRQILDKIKENFSSDITSYDVFIMEEHIVNWFPYELDE
ncbi:MAG: Lrp/AsnC family transcriptional regulator [Candidatus Micrarchaeota archaeon]|nr:Lrp/AsnC family transcriptional regulator [Candidatus Micrarchaeota archaeon]